MKLSKLVVGSVLVGIGLGLNLAILFGAFGISFAGSWTGWTFRVLALAVSLIVVGSGLMTFASSRRPPGSN